MTADGKLGTAPIAAEMMAANLPMPRAIPYMSFKSVPVALSLEAAANIKA
jgi:hypothetical protein